MAARKKKADKATDEKKVSRKRKTPRKPRKKATAKEQKEAVVDIDPNEPMPAKSLRGKILWEYRALYAEWKVAYAEGRLVSEKYRQEITDTNGQIKPKYKELLDLIALDQNCREEVRKRGAALKDAQVRMAEKLDLSYEEFVKNYTVDIDTGAVTYIGVE
jgi:hypothetical protein